MATNNLKMSLGSYQKYKNSITPVDGTIYFTTDTDNRTYIYLNGNNIVPYFIDLRNGGLGADLTGIDVNQYAIYMRGTHEYDSTYVNPAEGAFYTIASAEGVIQKPLFGTLPVKVGGTGKKTLTSGAILYGNDAGAVNELAAGTNGYILVSSGSAPKYVKPEMTWTAGKEDGPVFNFKFNGQSFTGVAIPAAGAEASGIITTGTQTIAGEKTLNNNLHTQSIYPVTTKGASLGSWSSASNHKLWSGVYSRGFYMYDANGYQTGTLLSSKAGTTSAAGYCGLTLGNTIKSGVAGNTRGILWLYGQNEGYASIEYTSTSKNSMYTLPSPAESGTYYLTGTKTSFHNTSDGQSFSIPFYISTGVETALGFTQGFEVYHRNGDESTTSGQLSLALGNNLPTGKLNNKRGVLLLYGSESGRTHLISSDSNGGTDYQIALPAGNGELIYHTVTSTQGGGGRLIQVSATGQITSDTTTDIASDITLMYLKDGLLTASEANKGSGTKLIHLKEGVITESDSSIAEDGKSIMYLNAGTLTKSTQGVAGKKQLMYLTNGTLTASDGNEGSSVKHIYLEDGVLKASTSTVGSNIKPVHLSAGVITESDADVGSDVQPVYMLDGEIVAANAYTTLLTDFSRSTNTLSVTVGGTRKTTTAVGSVSNAWANSTSAPTITTTVNGVASTAEAIPQASYSYAGVVNTSDNQVFKGIKAFANGIKISNGHTTTDCATLTYDGDTLTITFDS